jgi:phosphoglycerol transferase MdoB-like AlkP superfamily enzyme
VGLFKEAVSGTDAVWHRASSLGLRLLGLGLISVLLAWHLDPALRDGFNLGLAWRNALPLLLIALLLYGLFGRIVITAVVSAALIALVYKINAIKERNLHSPLTPDDAVLRHQVANNIGFFAHYTGYHMIILILAPVLLVIAVVALWRKEARLFKPHWVVRVALVLLSVVTLYTLMQGYRPWRELYARSVMIGYQQWNPIFSAQSKGFTATFVRMFQDRQSSVPPPDKSVVATFVSHHTQDIAQREQRQPPQELPDIVIVQSEAFFDPGVMKKVDFGQFDPNFERLAATGITGSLTTPTYGGGTIRTEFETLTGYPMMAFPAVQYPYFGLALPWMPTIPRRLQALGYTTTLFHPNDGDFWNRDETMPALGFQRMYFEDAFKDAPRAGLFVSDQSLFDAVLAHLDDSSSSPSYTMIITMENHGPWNRDPGQLANLLKTNPLPGGLSEEGTEQMTYYASHLINGDTALADFATKLLARKRWTIFLFYGDHLPALDAAYQDLGFDDNRAAYQEHTRYMVLSNRPFDSHQRRQLDLSAYDLPGLLFDIAGLPEDGYLALASSIRFASTHDVVANVDSYRNVQFNAARLEVTCGKKLNSTEVCAH